MTDLWTCDICNITIRIANKYKHLKTKKHKTNILSSNKKNTIQISYQTKNKDCIICCNESQSFKDCKRCNQLWCNSCDMNIFECPYCRCPLLGREEQLRIRKMENFHWQVDNENFINNNRFHIDINTYQLIINMLSNS